MYIYKFSIGQVGVEVKGGAVVGIHWNTDNGNLNIEKILFDANSKKSIHRIDFNLVSVVFDQLGEYFAGDRKNFDFPISLAGTEFQIRVWQQLQLIPYGETISYGKIASKIGNPKASRAVGMANNRNPISIVIPCHRVIGANGNLTGYAAGLKLKKKLLTLEQKYKGNDLEK
jgi:methylated-DNA-[protein]-cysteine S-methyltransferase